MLTPSAADFTAVPGLAWPGAFIPGNIGASTPLSGETVVFSLGLPGWRWATGSPRN